MDKGKQAECPLLGKTPQLAVPMMCTLYQGKQQQTLLLGEGTIHPEAAFSFHPTDIRSFWTQSHDSWHTIR